MPIDIEEYKNTKDSGLSLSSNLEKPNIYIPSKEFQAASGYNTNYTWSDTEESLKNKIANQQGFWDWGAKLIPTVIAGVGSGLLGTAGLVGIEAPKLLYAGGKTIFDNVVEGLDVLEDNIAGDGDNDFDYQPFSANYNFGNILFDLAEGIKDYTKESLYNYGNTDEFWGKAENLTTGVVSSAAEFITIGGGISKLTQGGLKLASLMSPLSMSRYIIPATGELTEAGQYLNAVAANYSSSSVEGFINSRGFVDEQILKGTIELNKKYEEERKAIEEDSFGSEDKEKRLEDLDKKYEQDKEYVRQSAVTGGLFTLGLNTALVGTLSMGQYNLFANSYNLLKNASSKLRGKTYSTIENATGKSMSELSEQYLRDVVSGNAKIGSGTAKALFLESTSEGKEGVAGGLSERLGTQLSESYLNEKGLTENYDGKSILGKGLDYLLSDDMVYDFFTEAYGGFVQKGAERAIGKFQGKDTEHQESVKRELKEFLQTYDSINNTIKEVSSKGAMIAAAQKYLEEGDYEKYELATKTLFSNELMNSFDNGTLKLKEAFFQNQIEKNKKEISDKKALLLDPNVKDPDTIKQQIEELESVNANTSAGLKIIQNYEKAYESLKYKYKDETLARDILHKNVGIELWNNEMAQTEKRLAAKSFDIQYYLNRVKEGKDVIENLTDFEDSFTNLDPKTKGELLNIAATHRIHNDLINSELEVIDKINNDKEFKDKYVKRLKSIIDGKELNNTLEKQYLAYRREQLLNKQKEKNKLANESLKTQELIDIEEQVEQERLDGTLYDKYKVALGESKVTSNTTSNTASSGTGSANPGSSGTQKQQSQESADVLSDFIELKNNNYIIDRQATNIHLSPNKAYYDSVLKKIKDLIAESVILFEQMIQNHEVLEQNHLADTTNVDLKAELDDAVSKINEAGNIIAKNEALLQNIKPFDPNNQTNTTGITKQLDVKECTANQYYPSISFVDQNLEKYSTDNNLINPGKSKEITDLLDNILFEITTKLQGNFTNDEYVKIYKNILFSNINKLIDIIGSFNSDSNITIPGNPKQISEVHIISTLIKDQITAMMLYSYAKNNTINSDYFSVLSSDINIPIVQDFRNRSLDMHDPERCLFYMQQYILNFDGDIAIPGFLDSNYKLFNVRKNSIVKDPKGKLPDKHIFMLESGEKIELIDDTSFNELLFKKGLRVDDSVHFSLEKNSENELSILNLIRNEKSRMEMIDPNEQLTSKTIEFDELTGQVSGAYKENGVIPEKTKKILNGEYNGKQFILGFDNIENKPKRDLANTKALISRLEKIFKGVSFKFISKEEMNKIVGRTDVKGVYKNGIIYLNEDSEQLDHGTAIHEIAHPFIQKIRLENRKLYKNLINQAKKVLIDGETVEELVNFLYPENKREEEYIVHALEQLGKSDLIFSKRKNNKINTESIVIMHKFAKSFIDIIKYLVRSAYEKFFEKLTLLKNSEGKPMLTDLLNKKQIEVKMNEIKHDMSIHDLSKLMLSLRVKFDLSELNNRYESQYNVINEFSEEIDNIKLSLEC